VIVQVSPITYHIILCISDEFQHLISVIEGSNDPTSNSVAPELSQLLQAQLEITFFESHSPAVKRTIEFIAENVWSNFLIFAKAELLPYLKKLTLNQCLYGEKAAEMCRARFREEMNKHMPQRCIGATKVCLEQLVSARVMQLCWRITLHKAKKSGINWINTYIKAGKQYCINNLKNPFKIMQEFNF